MRFFNWLFSWTKKDKPQWACNWVMPSIRVPGITATEAAEGLRRGIRKYWGMPIIEVDMLGAKKCVSCGKELKKDDKIFRLEVGLMSSDNGHSYVERGTEAIHIECFLKIVKQQSLGGGQFNEV